MKKVLPMLAIAAMAVSVSSARAQSTFRDVPDNHWAAAAVKRLADAGIIIGRPANEAKVSSTRSAKTASTSEKKHAAAQKRIARK